MFSWWYVSAHLLIHACSYILNRGWIDRSAHRVPTYKEVVSSKSRGKAKAADKEDEDNDSPDGNAAASEVDEEEEFEDIVDRFESSYNFRFEEP